MASSLTVDPQASAGGPRSRPRPVAPRRRRLRERISLGHLFMIASALLAFVLVVSVLQDRTATVRVLLASQEILPGATITPGMVEEVTIPAENDLVGSMATMNVIDGVPTASQRIAPGDPITLTALAPSASPTGLRAMSLPIERISAVGGDIAAGDRIDVISAGAGTARYVAVDLEVLATQSSQRSSGALTDTALTTYYVTVSVDDRTALELALALGTSEISILRSTGANPVDPAARDLVPAPAPPPDGEGGGDGEDNGEGGAEAGG